MSKQNESTRDGKIETHDQPVTFARNLHYSADVAEAFTELCTGVGLIHFGLGTRGVDEKEYVYSEDEDLDGHQIWEVLRQDDGEVVGFCVARLQSDPRDALNAYWRRRTGVGLS